MRILSFLGCTLLICTIYRYVRCNEISVKVSNSSCDTIAQPGCEDFSIMICYRPNSVVLPKDCLEEKSNDSFTIQMGYKAGSSMSYEYINLMGYFYIAVLKTHNLGSDPVVFLCEKIRENVTYDELKITTQDSSNKYRLVFLITDTKVVKTTEVVPTTATASAVTSTSLTITILPNISTRPPEVGVSNDAVIDGVIGSILVLLIIVFVGCCVYKAYSRRNREVVNNEVQNALENNEARGVEKDLQKIEKLERKLAKMKNKIKNQKDDTEKKKTKIKAQRKEIKELDILVEIEETLWNELHNIKTETNSHEKNELKNDYQSNYENLLAIMEELQQKREQTVNDLNRLRN